MAGRHKGDTQEFRELTFAEQARSITATINNLQAAIEHHVEHSPRRQETVAKCWAQVDRLRQRMEAVYGSQSAQSVSWGPVLSVEELSRFHVGSPRLAQPERAADFAKEVVEEPQDGPVKSWS
jgi:hypothetical protein